MDLSPFNRINPCGYAGLPMTQLKDLVEDTVVDYVAIEQSAIKLIANKLNVSEIEYEDTPPMR